METKRCRRCGEEKARTCFYANKANRDGLGPYCKPCKVAHVAEWRRRNPEKTLAQRAAYRERHAEAIAARVQASKDADPGRWAAYWRDYYSANADTIRARARRWAKDNPGRRMEQERKRRAAKWGAERIETIDRERVIARDNSTCHLCGKKVRRSDIHLDHLIPLSKGGTHTYNNVAVAHSRCNVIRGAGRTPAQLLLIG